MTTARTIPLLVGCLVGIIGVLGSMLALYKSVDRENCVTLHVNVSTEKADLVTAHATEFTDTEPVVNFRCGKVEVQPLNSGEAADLFMKSGWTKAKATHPDVWMPSTSMWAVRVEHRIDRNLFEGEDTSIAESPLVIAVPEAQAKVLQQRYNDLGWKDLRDLANADKAALPAALDNFGMGKDKPTLSSSGLAATIAAHHAAAKTPDELTLEDVEKDDVFSFVEDLESLVDLYAEDSVVFLENLYEGDQENKSPYIEAMVMQEQLAYQYNKGALREGPGNGREPNNPLVAIHPSDSTVVLDHPFLIVEGLGDDKRELAEEFRTFLLEDDQQRRFQEAGFRNSDGDATPDLADTVKSPKQLDVTSLKRPTGDVIEKVLENWKKVRVDVQVLLLIDISDSMARPVGSPSSKLNRVKSAVEDVLTRLDDDVKVGLWTLDEGVDNLDRIRESPLPADQARDKLINLVDSLNEDKTIEATPLYRGTHAAYNSLQGTTTKNEARSIVLLTDGQSEGEAPGAEKAFWDSIAADKTGSVRIFTIAYGDDADEAALEDIATKTKGVAYRAGKDNDDIEQVLPSVFKHF
ncbi:VWA domain-containing protein [Saccharomonospora azurea]|uniref:vWA domain-containing protein n=1 Tax=Saccharomonospora azurea TaxID=40988 RepID=UPI003D8E46CC